MSGVEIAGLVLGVLPLVVSALEGYKTAGNAFKRLTWKWRYEVGCLSRCVKTQLVLYKNSLKILLAAIGEEPSAGSDPTDLLANPNVQKRLAVYLEDADTLEVFEDVLRRYKESLDAIIHRLGHVKKGQQPKYDTAAVLAANTPQDGGFHFDQRFEFGMKHSEMREQIETLDDCNEILRKLIDQIDALNRTKSRDSTKEQTARKLAKELHEVRHRAIGLHAAIESCLGPACQPVHTFMLVLECRSAYGMRKSPTQKVTFHAMLACSEAAKALQQHCREAFISFDSNAAGNNKQALTDLCNGLTRAISKGEAVSLEMDQQHKLYCAAHQKSHFDLQFVQNSISLEEVLVNCVRLLPQQKTQLAIDIASSLLQLQTTPWLGTSWTNKVIRFVQHGSGGQQLIEYKKPFIARAFPNGGTAHSDDVVKTDMLELGIMLLEVWNLKTFEYWASENNIDLKPGYYPRMTPAIQWLEYSEPTMTTSYADAISVCVKFSFEGVPPRWEHPEFRRAFCEKVLGALQENCRAWIR